MCLHGSAWCWVEMLWSYLSFQKCQPLNILPQHHRKSRSLRNTDQSHLGNHQVVSWICFFSLLHQSFSSGSITAILPLSLLLLHGSSVQFMAVSQDHHLTDVVSRRAAAGVSGHIFLGLGQVSLLTFARGLLILCLLPKSSAKFPNFCGVSILILLVLVTHEGHRFHRATQPFTAMIIPQWTYSNTVSKG